VWRQFFGRTAVVQPLILDSPNDDKPQHPGNEGATMPNMPTTPPPDGPPPGWTPPQQPYQPPPGYVVPPQFRQQGDWWYDGRKWRPPVGAQPTRWELISQVPGMLIKLTFLLIALGIIVALLL
jgi:hypothetical protein